MANYPIHCTTKNGAYYTSQSSFYSDEYADKACDLHLRSQLIRDDKGRAHTAYRLRARQYHTIEDALVYNIYCPRCKSHLLKQIGRCMNGHELGLYICPSCEKY